MSEVTSEELDQRKESVRRRRRFFIRLGVSLALLIIAYIYWELPPSLRSPRAIYRALIVWWEGSKEVQDLS